MTLNMHEKDFGFAVRKYESLMSINRASSWAVPVDPDFFALNENLDPYKYDPGLAKELLFEAGYKVRTTKHEKAESLLENTDKYAQDIWWKKVLIFLQKLLN